MPEFMLQAHEELCMEIHGRNKCFRAVEHPSAAGMAYGMKGGKAKVYCLLDIAANTRYAIKAMKRKYQSPELEIICGKLDALKTIAGMRVCERICLTKTSAPHTVATQTSLLYAIIMPWLDGETWFDILKTKRRFTKTQAETYATGFASVLRNLEANSIAHCDLSCANILLSGQGETDLIDVEDIYAPGFVRPTYVSSGTPGYQHRESAQGLWQASADRFAGAILLAEILGWHDAAVRDAAYGESFFAPEELQTNCPRYDVLRQALTAHDARLSDLLDRAWKSTTMEAAPTLANWHETLTGKVAWGPAIAPSSRPAGFVAPFWEQLRSEPKRRPSQAIIVSREPIELPAKIKQANPTPVTWTQPGSSKPKGD